jgi:uncharacterized protein involved in cysteine biosynthesis
MGLLTGAGAFFRGMAFVVSTPGIWLRALVPMLTSLVLFGGLVALGLLGAAAVTHGVLVVLLTVVGWIFPPAVFVTFPLKVLLGALMIAWDLVDYPLALHGVRLGDRFRWAGRNFFAVLGFGLSATLFFAVPGLGLLALPCGVAGATRMVSRPGT